MAKSLLNAACNLFPPLFRPSCYSTVMNSQLISSETSLISPLITSQISAFHSSAPLFRFGLTLMQMHLRGGPPWRKPRTRSPISGQPLMKGTVLKVLIKKPKKPNSANRKCVLVKLSNGRETIAWIPGEGHNLQEHSQVLIKGGRKQDLIGVRVKVVRGRLDCAHVKKPGTGL